MDRCNRHLSVYRECEHAKRFIGVCEPIKQLIGVKFEPLL